MAGRKAKGLRPRKPGPMNEQERRIALSLKAASPHLTAAAIAKVLNKTKANVATYLHEARTMLQTAAPLAAQHVLQASAVAAAKGDAGPAQWLLERVSAQDEAGIEVRVVERPTQVLTGQGLTVNVGLGLANIPHAQAALGPAPSLPIEVTAEPVKADDSST